MLFGFLFTEQYFSKVRLKTNNNNWMIIIMIKFLLSEEYKERELILKTVYFTTIHLQSLSTFGQLFALNLKLKHPGYLEKRKTFRVSPTFLVCLHL